MNQEFFELLISGECSAAEALRRAYPEKYGDASAATCARAAYRLRQPKPKPAGRVHCSCWVFAQGIAAGLGPSEAFRKAASADVERMTAGQVAKAAAKLMKTTKYAAMASHMPKGPEPLPPHKMAFAELYRLASLVEAGTPMADALLVACHRLYGHLDEHGRRRAAAGIRRTKRWLEINSF